MKFIVVDKFSRTPKGRYTSPTHPDSGERFREEVAIPMLKQAIENDDTLTIDLTGYNRYGSSFIDEAFGALASLGKFSIDQINKHLKVTHDNLPSITKLIKDRIEYHDKNRQKITNSPSRT